MNDRMDLHHLRCAVAVADHGSFTAAAAALNISQPTLSYTIARLERELGARLFDRTPVRTSMTAAGEAFMGPARRSLTEADSARSAVNAVVGVVTGDLRIVSIRTAVVETAQLVARFHRHHPGVRIVVEEPTGDRGVVELMRSGRCDVGMMRSAEVPPDLVPVIAGEQETVVIFPEAAAPKKSTVSKEETARYPLVVPVAGTPARFLHNAFFRDVSIPPSGVVECSHQETYVELVRGGLGAAIVSSSRVTTMLTEGIAVRPLRPRSRTSLSVVRRTTTSPAAGAFCDVVGAVVPGTSQSRGTSVA
jgi:DNA-binding transcriptional LysR family regulator